MTASAATPGGDAAILIPMRLGASRLPGKGLRQIGAYSALGLLAGRLRRQCRLVHRILLCTTRESGDDPLVEVALALGLEVYRGSTEDVLLRLTEGAQSLGVTWVAEVDGDDVLCDPAHVDLALTRARATKADYFAFTDLPFGVAANILSTQALTAACARKTARDTSTGIFASILESGAFRVVREAAGPAFTHPRARLTLDYPQDLAFFRAVVLNFPGRELDFTLSELLALLVREPALVELNAGLNEAYWQHFNAHKVADAGRSTNAGPVGVHDG